MPSLNEIVFAIAERMPSPIGPPPSVLLEMLKFTVVYYRAILLRRDYADNLRYPQAALQELELETELVSRYEGSTTTFPVRVTENGSKVRRTVKPVPLPVRFKNWQEFRYVGDSSLCNPYTAVLPEEVGVRLSNKYTANTPCFYYTRGHIYLVNTSIKHVTIQYVLADPREIACDGSVSDDDEFKIPNDLLDGIVMGILSGELKTMTPPPSASTEIKE